MQILRMVVILLSVIILNFSPKIRLGTLKRYGDKKHAFISS